LPPLETGSNPGRRPECSNRPRSVRILNEPSMDHRCAMGMKRGRRFTGSSVQNLCKWCISAERRAGFAQPASCRPPRLVLPCDAKMQSHANKIWNHKHTFLGSKILRFPPLTKGGEGIGAHFCNRGGVPKEHSLVAGRFIAGTRVSGKSIASPKRTAENRRSRTLFSLVPRGLLRSILGRWYRRYSYCQNR
jgi:hypothetical protein